MELLHIYARNGVIKVIRAENKWIEHEKLLTEGWVETRTLNPAIFIEYLHNHCQPDEVYKEVENLICPF